MDPARALQHPRQPQVGQDGATANQVDHKPILVPPTAVVANPDTDRVPSRIQRCRLPGGDEHPGSRPHRSHVQRLPQLRRGATPPVDVVGGFVGCLEMHLDLDGGP